MEAPSRGDLTSIKDAQVALFKAVVAADPAHYVRGQYAGYRDIDGVAPDSATETYAAMRLEIQNSRWAGVPFFIRTGKRLPVTAALAVVGTLVSAGGTGPGRDGRKPVLEAAQSILPPQVGNQPEQA